MTWDNFVRKAFGVILLAAATAFAAPGPGETVAITEYMNNPAGSSATDEWVELYNYGDAAVNISGWHLKDDQNDSITIQSGVTIPAKSFIIMARNKSSFEELWLDGAVSAQVIQYATQDFALSDSGDDELVLTNASGVTVWRLAYPDNSSNTRSTFYADDDLSLAGWNCGTKASPINRAGNDSLTGKLGYEGEEHTDDPEGYSVWRDYGSPLRGAYTGANNPPQPPTTWSFSFDAPGQAISQGVRGLAIADQALNRHDNSEVTGIQPCLEVAEGSAIRGVAGGLYADMYDWKRRNDMPRPPTLEFMRWARDHNETLFVTANTRGLTEPSLTVPGHRNYYTSDTATLVQLAADWVRYTNHIVSTYRQGDTITDARDAAILDELTWSSDYVNEFGRADNYTKLLAPGEAAVEPVTYWEIGNEPTVSLNNAYSVDNGFTFRDDPAEYRDRYIAITQGMLAEDPTIKVGPCVVNGRAGDNAAILTTLLASNAQVDFISYHPYGSMNDYLDLPLGQQGYLPHVYEEQANFLSEIKALVAQYRPGQEDVIEYVASEMNVSDFRTNNQFQEGCMAHALGSVETVMSFARLGLKAAHYWIWITATPTYLDDYNRFIVTMAYEKMRDELGDTMVDVFDENDRLRGYALRDTDTGAVKLWLMNFSDRRDIDFHVAMTDAPAAGECVVTSTTLQAISGKTSLFSANLSRDMNFGVPRRDVDWTEPAVMAGADPAGLDVTLPAATLTLLKIKPTGAGVGGWELY